MDFKERLANEFQSELHNEFIFQWIEDACEIFMSILQRAISTSRISVFHALKSVMNMI